MTIAPEMIYLTAQTGQELDAVTRDIEGDQGVRAVVFTAPGLPDKTKS